MKERYPWRRPRRKKDRAGLTPVTAAIVLGAVILGVGAAGFVALTAVAGSGTHTSTVQSCYPITSPECNGVGNSTTQSVGNGASAAIPLAG